VPIPVVRSRVLFLASVAGLAGLVALALLSSRPSFAEEPSRSPHTVYLHVSGEGPQAKAWYDGGPPTGVLVQTALNHFSSQGYRFAAIASSGRGALQAVGGPLPAAAQDPAALDAVFVVLLQR
jgi:hypothetical protein